MKSGTISPVVGCCLRPDTHYPAAEDAASFDLPLQGATTNYASLSKRQQFANYDILRDVANSSSSTTPSDVLMMHQ